MIFNPAVAGGGSEFITGFVTQESNGSLVIPIKISDSQNFVVSFIGVEDVITQVPVPTVLSAYRVNGVEGCIDIGDDGGAPDLHAKDGVLSIEPGSNITVLSSPYGFCYTPTGSSWFYIIWDS